MKILLQYLRPFRLMVILVLVLAAINIGFSLVDPIIFGKLITLAAERKKLDTTPGTLNFHLFTFIRTTITNDNGKEVAIYGVAWLLLASITVAMVSRIAKNFQDYFL